MRNGDRRTWLEYADSIRRNIYWLNMDLLHWDALGERSRAANIRDLIEANHRILDTEQRSHA